jgi:hypothetical protein
MATHNKKEDDEKSKAIHYSVVTLKFLTQTMITATSAGIVYHHQHINNLYLD